MTNQILGNSVGPKILLHRVLKKDLSDFSYSNAKLSPLDGRSSVPAGGSCQPWAWWAWAGGEGAFGSPVCWEGGAAGMLRRVGRRLVCSCHWERIHWAVE